MKNKIILVIAFISFGLFFTNIVFADTNINLQIKNNSHIIYDGDINVIPCDSDNNVDSPDIETPYCAIMQSSISNVWDWTWAPGAFVTSIDNIAGSTTKDENGNDVYHYWGWFLNGSEAQEGLNQYQLKNDDKILLDFINPIEEKKIEPVAHHVFGSYILPIITTPIVSKIFNTENALKFLVTNQKIDGSFGEPIYTDWGTLAVVAGGDKVAKEKLIKYYKENNFETPLFLLTDYERRAMALMALGIDPYNGTGVNYIKKITDSFDGEQIGDENIVNDDIFALIVLKNAGYNEKDEIVAKDINYIISKQGMDGSLNSVDMTGAFLQALRDFNDLQGVDVAISKAEKYLISKQGVDFDFGNSFSTSWVLQSLYNNEKVLKGEKYLISKQETDGGLESVETDMNTRIWATAYALPAVLHLSWNEIMESFPRQEIELIKETIPPILTVNKKTNVEVLQTLNPEIISSNSDTNNITIDSNDSNIKNLFKNKIIIMTIILTLGTFIGGWFVIKS